MSSLSGISNRAPSSGWPTVWLSPDWHLFSVPALTGTSSAPGHVTDTSSAPSQTT